MDTNIKKEFKAEIKEIEKTLEKEEKEIKKQLLKIPWVRSLIYFVLIFGSVFGFLFWQLESSRVYIENSYLDAPIVNLTPVAAGTLNALYAKEGDRVVENSPIALVGSQTIYTKEGGIVSSAPLVLGSYYAIGQTVVSVVNDRKMRVVGKLEENKGLEDIKVGQHAIFTVDTFSGKQYEGVVSEISPVSIDTGVVFSISDNRPTKKFNIYMSFDSSKYPELKSGMSAKSWVYVK